MAQPRPRRARRGDIASGRRWYAEWLDDDGKRRQVTGAERATVAAAVEAAGLRSGRHGVRIWAYWYARFEAGPDPRTGKRVRIVRYGPTEAAAVEAARHAKQLADDERERGLAPAQHRTVTVAEWLDYWLEQPSDRRRPSTVRQYRSLVRTHVAPSKLGSARMVEVRPRQVEQLLAAMADDDRLKGSTRAAVRRMLSSAFADAVREDVLAANPVTAARGPVLDDVRTGRALTDEQVQALVDAAAGTDLAAFFAVAVYLGLRKGEVLGLRWQDIDLGTAVLHVRHSLSAVPGGDHTHGAPQLALTKPKTRSSIRTVPVPAHVVEALLQHRAMQERARAEAGERWVDTGHVFTTTIGTPIHPQTAQKRLGAVMAAAGLEGIRLHDLRHTAVTALYRAADVTTAAAVAGHSGTRTTSAVYVHPTAEDLRPAVERASRAARALDTA